MAVSDLQYLEPGVGGEGFVVGDDHKTMAQRLRDDDTIEGIPMHQGWRLSLSMSSSPMSRTCALNSLAIA
jgi:hypothetical protein